MLRIGYNTNGFPHHRLEDALRILADLGYQAVAITLDYHALNPYDANHAQELGDIRTLLENLKLRCVIETGARFLLDPWRKHQPTLLSANAAERETRLDFLRRAVHVARELNADAVSFWAGTPATDEPEKILRDRLCDGCLRLADVALKYNVRLAFEPEPGMFIDTMDRFRELHENVAHPNFGLTIDIGHLHCLGEGPVEKVLHDWRHCLWNIHIEDMRRGVHEHLMFDDGEIDFPPILRTLEEIGYMNGVYVELSRHGHDAVNIARRARREFLTGGGCKTTDS